MITPEIADYLIWHGAGLMVAALLALVGVLHALHTALVAGYHELLWADPLAPPRSRVERHHLTRRCATCRMHAELITTRLVP